MMKVQTDVCFCCERILDRGFLKAPMDLSEWRSVGNHAEAMSNPFESGPSNQKQLDESRSATCKPE